MQEVMVKNIIPTYKTVSVSPVRTITFEQPKLDNDEIDWGDDSFEIEEFAQKVELKKILVEKVLNKWEKTTNSDTLLYFECIRAEFPEIEITTDKRTIYIRIPKKLMRHMSSPASYLRARRELNAQNKCLPTNPRVREKRQRNFRVIKRYFGQKNGK